jgi:hypothetical protein
MGGYLALHAVSNVVVTGQEERALGSNNHLAGFLAAKPEADVNAARVLLSTSLLRVGLILIRRCRMCSCWSHRGTWRTFCTARGARRGRVGVGGLSFLEEVVGVGQGKFARCASGSFALKTRR